MAMVKKWPGARPKLPDDGRTQEALKADFHAAHQAASQALTDRDFEGMAKAIERERVVIEQQRARVDKLRPAPYRRRT